MATAQSQALSAIVFLYQQVLKQIVVRDGKGRKDRVPMLPRQVKASLQRHLHDVQRLHMQDVQAGAGHVYLPYALERKYPNASRE